MIISLELLKKAKGTWNYFLREGFLEFAFLEVVAVCGLTKGDFSFLSFSDPFIFDY